MINVIPSKQTDKNIMKMKADTIGPGIVVTNAQKIPENAAAIIIIPVIIPGNF